MENRAPQRFYFAVFAFGFAAMAAQIVLMRELLVVFYGNELSAGVMLAAWLFWVSVGSVAARPWRKYAEEAFHILLLSVPVTLPLTISFIRNTRNFAGTAPGEIIGIIPVSIASFAFLAPACFTFGALFTLGCRLTSGPSKTYMAESAGAVAGALAFDLLFVRAWGPMETALFCGLLTSASVLFIAERSRSPSRWWTTFAFTAFTGIFLVTGSETLDLSLRKLQWRDLGLVSVKDTRFGNITRTRHGPQENIFENGLLVSSSDDVQAAELSVHPALLEHPDPKRVLLIGGSLGGALEEVLKHPVVSVDYVDLDPALVKISRDPRATAHYQDGRLFVKRAAADGVPRYDAVIVALPNPYTAQINRFYSLEFCREVKAVLSRGGIFSFTVSSAADYISPAQAQFLACLKKTLGTQFADVRIIPGDTAVFLASSSQGVLTEDWKVLARRIEERRLSPGYVNAHYLPDIFDPMRIAYAGGAVSASRSVKINRDFRPAGYYYDMVLWSSRTGPRLSAALGRLNGFDANRLLLAMFSLFAAAALLWYVISGDKGFPYLLSIASAGFSGITAQVCLIVAYQAVYGYVYERIGFLFAAFMAGLVIGAAAAKAADGQGAAIVFRRVQSFFYIYSFLLALSVLADIRFSQALFFLLSAVPGILTGALYPLAVRLHSAERPADSKKPAYSAGLVYGVDLAGACIGALIVSSVVIPVMGISRAFLLAGLMSFSATCLLYLQLFRSRT